MFCIILTYVGAIGKCLCYHNYVLGPTNFLICDDMDLQLPPRCLYRSEEIRCLQNKANGLKIVMGFGYVSGITYIYEITFVA